MKKTKEDVQKKEINESNDEKKETNFWTAKHKKGIFEYSVIDLVVLGVGIVFPKSYTSLS